MKTVYTFEEEGRKPYFYKDITEEDFTFMLNEYQRIAQPSQDIFRDFKYLLREFKRPTYDSPRFEIRWGSRWSGDSKFNIYADEKDIHIICFDHNLDLSNYHEKKISPSAIAAEEEYNAIMYKFLLEKKTI